MSPSIAEHIGAVHLNTEALNRRDEFVQCARFLIAAGGHGAAQRMAQQSHASPRVIEALQHKAATAAGTITDSQWAAPLAQGSLLATAFVESLRDVGAFDRLLPDMLRVPPLTKLAVVTAGVVGASVGEAMAKPVGRVSLAAQAMDPLKACAFVVLSQELMRMGGAGAIPLLRRELTGAVAQVTDEIFISTLTAGLTAIPSSGFTALGARADLRALLDAVDTGAASKLYLLTTSSIAKRLSIISDASGGSAFPQLTAQGGSVAGIPLVVSDGVPSGQLILCDASQLAAVSGPVELDISTQGAVQMDTVPDSPPTASTNLVSLWQMNYAALRCERYFAVERLRDTAVAVVSGVTATGNSPS
jgi:hypothetical protein